jgi:hypothetical protein
MAPLPVPRTLLLTLGLLASACDGGKGLDSGSAGDSTGGSTGGTTTGAVTPITTGGPAGTIAVDCSFVFADVQVDRTYLPDEAFDTPVGGKLIAGGALFDDEFEGRSFTIRMFSEDGAVLSSVLYQFASGTLPVNEFAGDHGFTGLHAVKDPDADEVVQFACFARDAADPPHFWE